MEQDRYHRSQQQQQQRQRDDFDSEDDGDFIVDDLGTERRQGRRQQQERYINAMRGYFCTSYDTRSRPDPGRTLCETLQEIWSVKTRRAPSRHCRNARVYRHMTSTMLDNEYPPPLPVRLFNGNSMRPTTGTGSFQGGASGPSQDQVYEAIEIFGESIQDFDFMKPVDEEGEVSRSVVRSAGR